MDQTFANDIRAGDIMDPLNVVCVVVDEAHRAQKNHSYCELVDLLLQAARSSAIQRPVTERVPGNGSGSEQGFFSRSQTLLFSLLVLEEVLNDRILFKYLFDSDFFLYSS